jgi:lipopolysaccharide/colanic/teichoic acid biosynthesis glycosyltransferase
MTFNSQLIPVKSLQKAALRGLNGIKIDRKFMKRLFDIVFSATVLTLGAPLYGLVALLIALSSPGPVFFVQTRVGKDFKRFNCIKFRTMVINADQVLEQLLAESPAMRDEFERDFKLKQDPRITWIGKFLRLTSLDEFPQFWNVLKGDMSVVGPRPLVPDEIHRYGTRMARVLTIRPGITGLWQVSGRNDIPYTLRVRIDSHYAINYSWLLDLVIIAKTFGVILFPKNNGAY